MPGKYVLRKLIAMSFLAAAPSAAVADTVALEGEQLKQTVAGSLVALDTPIGTTIPVRFGNDGLMSGEAGSLAGYLGAPKDRGRWWVADNRLCLKWFRWFDAEQACLSIQLKGERVFWQQDNGKTGTGTIVERAKPLPIVMAAASPAPSRVAPPAAVPPPPRKPIVVADVFSKPTEVVAHASTDADPAASFAADKPTHAETDHSGEPRQSSAVEPASGIFAVGTHLSSAGVLKLRKTHAARKTSVAPVQRPAARHAPPPVLVRKPTLVGQSGVGATNKASSMPSPMGLSALARPSFRVSNVSRHDVLYVRRGPSSEHDAVGSIAPASAGIEMTGRCVDGWCPIRASRIKGWVNSYYLAEDTVHVAASGTPYRFFPR